GAAAIVDHDLLAERLAHALGGGARHGVGSAAGREWHDQRDRSAGIVLRGGALRRQRPRARRAGQECDNRTPRHGALPTMIRRVGKGAQIMSRQHTMQCDRAVPTIAATPHACARRARTVAYAERAEYRAFAHPTEPEFN